MDWLAIVGTLSFIAVMVYLVATVHRLRERVEGVEDELDDLLLIDEWLKEGEG